MVVYWFGVTPGLTALAASLVATQWYLLPRGQSLELRYFLELLSLALVGSLVAWATARHRHQRESLRAALAHVETLHAAQERILADVLRSATQGKFHLQNHAGSLPVLRGGGKTLSLEHSGDLAPLRAAVRDAAREAGLSPDRGMAFLTAVHEAAMNAIRHGGGGVARIGPLGNEPGRLGVSIVDEGPGISLEALPERALHGGVSGADSLGMGFSLVLAGVDYVYLTTGPEGTAVVLEVNETAPLPAWLMRPVVAH